MLLTRTPLSFSSFGQHQPQRRPCRTWPRRRPPRRAGSPACPATRHHVHDHAVLALEHLRQHRLRAVERAVEVRADHHVPRLRRQFAQRAVLEVRAGVVHQDIDAAERLRSRSRSAPGTAPALRHVGRDGAKRRRRRSSSSATASSLAASRPAITTFAPPGGTARRSPADARPAAGDDRDLVRRACSRCAPERSLGLWPLNLLRYATV